MSPDTGENSQLAGVVVCISGDPTFDKDENKHIREQFIDENVGRWLKYRSGQLVEEISNATTHLICSRAAYRARNDKSECCSLLVLQTLPLNHDHFGKNVENELTTTNPTYSQSSREAWLPYCHLRVAD